MRLGLILAVPAMSLFLLTERADAEPQAEPEPAAESPSEPPQEPPPDAVQLDYEYTSWFGLHRREAHYGRAALEVVGLMGIGLLYYWLDPLANKEDWDNPTINDRLHFRAIRFDTNLNTTNHFMHPIAGGFVYTAARVNNLSVPAAFGYGLAQSFLWELGFEWREKSSLNDLVFTTVGGATLGEWFYELGEYLNSAPDGGAFAQRTAAWTLGFPRRIHRAIDGDGPTPAPLAADSLGFSAAYAHRFSLGYEQAFLSNDAGDKGPMYSVKLGTEIIGMPRFLHPITFSRGFWNGNFTELDLRLGWGDGGFVESDLQARATLFGHYEQDFDEEGDGHALMLGVGPALRFQKSSWLGRDDQLSAVHVFGPQAELWLRDGPLAARFGADTYIDFGAIASLAYPQFVDRFNDVELKSILQRQGYAYSLGSWSRFRAKAAYGVASLGGSVAYGRYGTIEGADRFQERLTQDAHGTESVLEIEGRLAVQLGIVEIAAGYRERRRESELGEVFARRRDRNFGLTFGLVF